MIDRRAVRLGTSRPLAVVVLLSLTMVWVVACGSKPHQFQLTNLSQSDQPDLKLMADTTVSGQPISADKLRGDWVILYFGFTHCPNICPTTLAKLNAAIGALKPDAAGKVRVVFVSVDPKRDTPEVLSQYVHAFNPRFIGLRPPQAKLDAFTGRYHMSYSYGKPDKNGAYTVNHSSEFMVFGPQGHMRLMGSYDDSTDAITSDLRYLVRNG